MNVGSNVDNPSNHHKSQRESENMNLWIHGPTSLPVRLLLPVRQTNSEDQRPSCSSPTQTTMNNNGRSLLEHTSFVIEKFTAYLRTGPIDLR